MNLGLSLTCLPSHRPETSCCQACWNVSETAELIVEATRAISGLVKKYIQVNIQLICILYTAWSVAGFPQAWCTFLFLFFPSTTQLIQLTIKL
jgi:hypothetical protein